MRGNERARMTILDGKVAIVTGAGQGLGRAEALLMARSGAKVIVNDRKRPDGTSTADTVVAEILAMGGIASANYADVSDWGEAEEMVRQAISEYGKLDILVCNAGIVRDKMTFNLSESEWDDVIRVNLKGHFAPARHAVVHWRNLAKETGEPARGRIIFTSSESGLYGNLGQPNYSTAKAGVTGLTFELAKEVGRLGITVNAICPRGRTPMTETTFGAFKQDPNLFDSWDPHNVAPWVTFLGSDHAEAITGQIFVVYGGTVECMTPWPVKSSFSEERRWEPEELIVQARKLFPDMTAMPPEAPDPGIPV